MGNEISMELARRAVDQSSTHCFAQPSNHSLIFRCLWVKIMNGNTSPCSKLNLVQNSDPKQLTVPKRASGQIPIEQHSHFRWWSAKAWKLPLAWFWNDCNRNSRKWEVMSESHVETCIVWIKWQDSDSEGKCRWCNQSLSSSRWPERRSWWSASDLPGPGAWAYACHGALALGETI